ncbi:MAG: hypothetical protein K2J71_02615 [Oscillospiraceae bacterium]|nr:hypothetical protein [Oscillospiraceae bacterium]
MLKFTCPHCNEKTFTPLQKALAGSMKSVGKPCPNCGRKCCNGMESAYFDSIISVIMIVTIFVIYMKSDASAKVQSSILIAVIILARFVLSFLFRMFFGKLVHPVRTMR